LNFEGIQILGSNLRNCYIDAKQKLGFGVWQANGGLPKCDNQLSIFKGNDTLNAIAVAP